jgi:hypothetical protein
MLRGKKICFGTSSIRSIIYNDTYGNTLISEKRVANCDHLRVQGRPQSGKNLQPIPRVG